MTTVTSDHIRIQFLTDRFIRLEWSEDGSFEDRLSLAVANRKMPEVKFDKKETGKGLTISTSGLSINYTGSGDAFCSDNLSIKFKVKGKTKTWKPGMPQTENLGATARTLDGVNGNLKWRKIPNPIYREGAAGDAGKEFLRLKEELDLGYGFISRAGWVLIDDSENVLIDNDWVKPRPEGKRQDLYFLAYGHDYKSAISDAAKVFGRQPLPPRYALGYWWSRYWAYTDREIESLMDSFDSLNVPIDVMVIDMDWHLEGWTGYTWDKRYFPDPDEFLANLKDKGVKATLNLHPHDGVRKHEEQFEEMAKAMKLDPKKVDHIPFDITDPEYMKNYFRILHHPDEKRGIDFWWMDWQQGETTSIKGLDCLPWINHLHWVDMEENPERGNKRPLIFSRYGGIGAGRYCIGFSGDTISNWDSLAYQPYFTATASNVLYGYWSHDIGGHMPGPIEPELYLRWVQYGLYSPVFRTHTTKNNDAERRFWEYPDPYDKIMMQTVRERYAMVPYIYSECRKAYDTGISLCRPMYYDWPEEDEAYTFKDQYMFGDEMLVSPVINKGDETSKMALVKTWLPKGDWWNVALGKMEKGGQVVSEKYMLNEIPVFVRAGSVVPGQKNVKRLNDSTISDLTVTIYPGKKGSYTLYEDDGLTSNYQDKGFVCIPITHEINKNQHSIKIGSPNGKYKGFSSKKNLELRLPGTVPPKSVEGFDYYFRLGDEGWTYDGDTATTIIRLSNVSLKNGITLNVTHGVDSRADSLKGIINRLDRVAYYFNSVALWDLDYKDQRLSVDLEQVGNRVSRNPDSFNTEIKRLYKRLPDLKVMTKEIHKAFAPRAATPPERMECCHIADAILDALLEMVED